MAGACAHCGKVLRSHNKYGYCKPHQWNSPEWRAHQKERARRYNSTPKAREAQRLYKLTPSEKANRRRRVRAASGLRNATGEQRSGPCEICLTPTDNLCCDHDHKTGEFRGWLCRTCNSGIGLLKDSPTVLRRAALYLEACCAAG